MESYVEQCVHLYSLRPHVNAQLTCNAAISTGALHRGGTDRLIEFIRKSMCVCVCDEGDVVGNYILPVRLLTHGIYIYLHQFFLGGGITTAGRYRK